MYHTLQYKWLLVYNVASNVFRYALLILGCGQVVRHQVLVLAFGGSNPSIPAIEITRPFGLVISIVGFGLEPPVLRSKTTEGSA